jgi:hypothetical protein
MAGMYRQYLINFCWLERLAVREVSKGPKFNSWDPGKEFN